MYTRSPSITIRNFRDCLSFLIIYLFLCFFYTSHVHQFLWDFILLVTACEFMNYKKIDCFQVRVWGDTEVEVVGYASSRLLDLVIRERVDSERRTIKVDVPCGSLGSLEVFNWACLNRDSWSSERRTGHWTFSRLLRQWSLDHSLSSVMQLQ